MLIEEIARAVAAEWKMSFDGIELDFALEVARRSVENEREACAKACEERPAYSQLAHDCAEAIRARSNAEA